MTRNYGNPPIREAIFDISIELKTEFEKTVFDTIISEISEHYPQKDTINEGEFSVEFKKGVQSNFESKSEECGVKLTSGDGTQIVQFRKSGFTFSKLKPYCGWEDFYNQAVSLFEKYNNALSSNFIIKRVAIRYVNAISIPKNNFKLEDYFLTAPTIAESVPQGLNNFFMRLFLTDDNSEAFALVNQTVEPTKEDGAVILFDIDVFMNNLSTKPEEFDLEANFEILKKFRTTIFEGSITDKVRALIE
jgi:uncharacterized protein (TIGR04255 family)